jgi:hypothetical protein
VPLLIQGRIVYSRKPIPDPQGRNPKPNRPFVVITGNSDIPGATRVEAVAITDELHLSPSEHYFRLPTAPGANKHGCTPGSAALCSWVVSLEVSELDVRDGYLPGKYLFQIIERVKALKGGSEQA